MTKTQEVKEIADGVLSFLKKKNMEDSLPELIDMLKEGGSEDIAYIYSPKELEVNEKKKAEKLLTGLIGKTPRKISFSIEKELIDGLKLKFGDKVWDFSVKAQISNFLRV